MLRPTLLAVLATVSCHFAAATASQITAVHASRRIANRACKQLVRLARRHELSSVALAGEGSQLESRYVGGGTSSQSSNIDKTHQTCRTKAAYKEQGMCLCPF